jgi:3',5'-cyclic-nucleotide phosphodiesterase
MDLKKDAAFQIVVMGCSGGPYENSLSGYLLSPLEERQQWITLDAGSLLCGIECALTKNALTQVPFTDPQLKPAVEMLVRHVKAYMLSHAHLDHLAALVLNSQIDSSKPILGIDTTINNIRDHIFNGKIWPNYGNEGGEPILSLYQYVRLPLHQKKEIPNTEMSVEAYLLSHPGGYASSAFLLEYKGHYLLYFGDTAADSKEVEKHLERIWRRVAPLLQKRVLHGILLECSYPHEEAHQVIYGHLDTHLMMEEFHRLAEIARVSLEGLNVLVTHRKQSFKKRGDNFTKIQSELMALNDLGLRFHFPEQGDFFIF